jgi:hypothetical protein
MKRNLILIGFFALALSAFSADGFQATYSVKVTSGSSYEYNKVITVCGDAMRIQLSSDRFFIFDRQKKVAWKVNVKSKEAITYSFDDNQPFYHQFLMPYGLMDNNGQLIFPQVIFKRTGNRKVVQGVPCFEAKLPGEFMNSTTTVWLPEKAENDGSNRFFQFMSFFTGNEEFLDLMHHGTGFPRRIVSRIRLNSSVSVNTQVLTQIKDVSCDPVLFALPKGIKVRKAAPSGIPLRRF